MKNFSPMKWFDHILNPTSMLLKTEAFGLYLDSGSCFKPFYKMKSFAFRAIVFLVLLNSNLFYAQQNFTTFQAASLVVGQTNFTAATSSCSQSGLNAPSYTAISSKGVLAIAEQGGGRVKLWNTTQTVSGSNASVEVGKTSFTDCSFLATTQSSISNSNGVAFSPDGNKLIVSDFPNNRVLIWNTIPTSNGANASVVLGQANFTSNTSGTSQTSMNGPTGVFVSQDGKLIVSEYNNNRVLIWNSIPTVNNTPADVVVGQSNFTSSTFAISATGLGSPWGVCVSPDGKLVVADFNNNRVMVWNTVPTTNGVAADVVIGQPNFTSSAIAVSSTGFSNPIGVSVSPSGKLAIGEYTNNRVMIYNTIPTTNGAAANVVLGQQNFTALGAYAPSGTPTSTNMISVYGVSFDLYGRLFVVGRTMNRAMVFGTLPATTAELGIGITSNIATACFGASNTLTITITNSSPIAATGVIAAANLPAGFTYSSHSTTTGTYNTSSGYWTIGTIPANSSITLTVNGLATVSGSFTAYASILQSNQLDTNFANNGANVSYAIASNVLAPTGTANQIFCGVATVSNLTATGTALQWYANPSGGTALSSSFSLVSGGTYYASQTIGSCESLSRFAVSVTLQPFITFYADIDGDGFGNPAAAANFCAVTPGYVLNNTDCNDNQIQFLDADGDGFGATTQVACGVANNWDTNDNLLTYMDNDADGFGAMVLTPSGVTSNSDCDDSQWEYLDADGDGFGSTTLVACGVLNNFDTNDNLLLYTDADGDGFGSTLFTLTGVTNNLDCNDAEVRYLDADSDGYGSTAMIKVACGGSLVSTDCDDANASVYRSALLYTDADADGYTTGSSVTCYGSALPVGTSLTTLGADCNDANASMHAAYPFYTDTDHDTYGTGILVSVCAVNASTPPTNYSINNTDCNDTNALVYRSALLYTDADADGYTVGSALTCYGATLPIGTSLTTLGTDCNDAAASMHATYLFYSDTDHDAYGTGSLVNACAVNALTPPANYSLTNTDCNDTNGAVYRSALLYTDADADGFSSGSSMMCYGVALPIGTSLTTLGTDCNDVNASMNTTYAFYVDADNDTYGSGGSVMVCAVNASTPPTNYAINSTDCNDTKSTTHPGAVELCYDGIDNDCNGNIDNIGLPGGCVPMVSTVIPTQCGVTLSLIDDQVYAVLIANAQGYRWRITKLVVGAPVINPSDIQTLDTGLRAFKFTQLATYAFDTNYQIEVSVRLGGVWQPYYGSACTVKTPATTTKVSDSQCGTRLTLMTDVVYANLVPFATGYRFRVTNLLTSTVSPPVDRSLREFRFNLLSTISYNTPYKVEVAVRNTDGTYLPYGPSCNIITPFFPTTQLQASQCDYTAISNSEIVYADLVSNATAYRFSFESASTTIVAPPNNVRAIALSTVVGLVPDIYSVKVAVQIGGIWGPYGKTCTLTLPGTAKATDVNIKPMEQSDVFEATAYPNPFAASFKLEVTTNSQDNLQVRVYDMIGKPIENKLVKASDIKSFEVGADFPSGVYNVVLIQGEQTKTLRVIKR